MGDIQYILSKKMFEIITLYSISGYTIAEAGAKPISQLAFTWLMVLLMWSITWLEAWK